MYNKINIRIFLLGPIDFTADKPEADLLSDMVDDSITSVMNCACARDLLINLPQVFLL